MGKDDYEFLVEKEAMWAEMLMQVLKDNRIPHTAVPVHGAGLTLKTGMRERIKVFVAPDQKTQAEEILQGLFSAGDTL